MRKLKLYKNIPVLITAFTITILSCERKVESQSQSANLMDEVMAIHDSVMPKMGALRTTRKALLEKADNTSDSTLAVMLLTKADELDSAQQAMMVWMRQFNPTYYEDQKKMIQDVKDLMESSLADGKGLLE